MIRRRLALAAGAGALCAATVLSASACSVPSFDRVGKDIGVSAGLGDGSRVGMGVGSYTTTWTVGSCHRLDQLIETDPVYNSDTSPAVSCRSPHESETFAVEPVSGAVARPAERPSPEWLQSALAGSCSAKALAQFLGAQATDASEDIAVLRIVPSVPEWAAGVRKVRCDALVGPRTAQSVASVSRSLRGILATAAGDRFRTCRLGGVELACNGLHTAELVGPQVKFTAAELAKGPGYALKKVAKACQADVAAYVGAPLDQRPDLKLYPEPPGVPPQTDSTVGSCWVGSATGLSTTGSVRRTGPGKVS
jgi:Septum formation